MRVFLQLHWFEENKKGPEENFLGAFFKLTLLVSFQNQLAMSILG